MSNYSIARYVLDDTGRTAFPLPYPFDPVRQSLSVSIDGELVVLPFTYDKVNAQVVFASPPTGVELTLRRITDVTNRLVTFNAGALLNEVEMNHAVGQLFYTVQELRDLYLYVASTDPWPSSPPISPPADAEAGVTYVCIYQNGAFSWKRVNTCADSGSGGEDVAEAIAKHNISVEAHDGLFDPAGTADSRVSDHNSAENAHADIRELITSRSAPGWPNYAAGQDKMAAYNVGGKQYTATANGWCWVRLTSTNTLFVNGVKISWAGGDAPSNPIFPVKSGDIISGGSVTAFMFYPERGA